MVCFEDFLWWQKIPIISPLLIKVKLETNFKKKAYSCNVFFASKCVPLINSSALPELCHYISAARLSSINFNNVDILKIIKSPDIWKKSNITPVHKKVTNKPLIIIDLFLFYWFVAKFSKNCYSSQYLNFLMIIIFSVLIIQDSDHQIFMNINFF